METIETHISDLVAGMRACADWLEANPTVPMPYDPKLQICSVNTKAEVAALARLMGKCEKEVTDSMFKVVKRFGPVFHVEGIAYREQVCERIVVGTKVVTKAAEPARAALPERTEEVEIVEWKCGALMSAPEIHEPMMLAAAVELPMLEAEEIF